MARGGFWGLGWGLALLVWAQAAWAVSVTDVVNPRPSGGWVSDQAEMIDAATEARLNAMIDAAEKELGVEIAVVTVTDVDSPTPKDFATELFNHWKIGKAGQDNGLLVLMVRDQRRLEMETGYGLESSLTDGWLKTMQQERMVPAFKAGRYGAGLEAGVHASIQKLGGTVPPLADAPDLDVSNPNSAAPVNSSDPRPQASAPRRSEPNWALIAMGATGVVAVGGAGAWHHRRQRTCPQCAIRMEMIPDEEDDVKLDAGQRTEEAIGSVDYQLFFCKQCGFNRVIENGKWFSGYSRCGGCGYKTSRTTSTTISAATTTSTGLEEVSTSCEHCGASSTHTRVIPMISPPSDNSSSSSSSFGGGSDSFGGGSSGGGGAGSSW